MWVRGLKHFVGGQSEELAAVAPYVGAWIETYLLKHFAKHGVSHPMWVRGLKLIISHRASLRVGSHPMWVRGLKLLWLNVV